MRSALSLLVVTAAVASAWPLAQRACVESSKFGDLEAVPSDLYSGASFTVHADFTCAINLGVMPIYIDYYVEDTNGSEPAILLGRREFHDSAPPPPADTFSAEIPIGPTYTSSANYVVKLYTTFGSNNTQGTTYYQTGTTTFPITIAASS